MFRKNNSVSSIVWATKRILVGHAWERERERTKLACLNLGFSTVWVLIWISKNLCKHLTVFVRNCFISCVISSRPPYIGRVAMPMTMSQSFRVIRFANGRITRMDKFQQHKHKHNIERVSRWAQIAFSFYLIKTMIKIKRSVKMLVRGDERYLVLQVMKLNL